MDCQGHASQQTASTNTHLLIPSKPFFFTTTLYTPLNKLLVCIDTVHTIFYLYILASMRLPSLIACLGAVGIHSAALGRPVTYPSRGVYGSRVSAPIARQAPTNETESTPNLSSAQALAAFPDGYWLNDLSGNGRAAFNDNGAYKVFRNVKEYGAKGEYPTPLCLDPANLFAGDGVTDDSDAFNRAISDGNRCGPWVCDSSTDSPAVVYVPSGTYLINKPIVFYYMTQLIGNPRGLPVLKAAPTLDALALIDASPYNNQNGAPGVSFQVRNICKTYTNLGSGLRPTSS
jgi:glucan 1,3-beta-glucosidase